jgi:hypothetical protein
MLKKDTPLCRDLFFVSSNIIVTLERITFSDIVQKCTVCSEWYFA